MTSKKSEKKDEVLETLDASDVPIETLQETKAREKAEKAEQRAEEQYELEKRAKAKLQFEKGSEITDFLKEQGLGQNARHKVFVLFEELRKLKCKEGK